MTIVKGRRYLCSEGRYTKDCIVLVLGGHAQGESWVRVFQVLPTARPRGAVSVGDEWEVQNDWLTPVDEHKVDPNILFKYRKIKRK